ncbi:MAG: Mrp/NBP35 family ATP-binding protein [Syntrophales bacterium]
MEEEQRAVAQDEKVQQKMSQIQRKIIVMSGKGGVGKTSVAVNLSYGWALQNKKVGLLDVDIHGPNVAKMLNIEKERLLGSDLGVEPVRVLPNLRAVSLALLGYDPDNPIIWRGPLKFNAIKQLLGDVNWGALDYLVIDSPPGTGDEPLSVCQLIPDISGSVIVTTPQDMSILDARKSVYFSKRLGIPVIGIIENMSGLICPHCHKEIQLFKKGGGEKAARDIGVPFLGRIPFEPELVDLADQGIPFVYARKDSAAGRVFAEILIKIEAFLSTRH